MTDVEVSEDQRQDAYGDRDKERTPMQWSSDNNAGFTSGMPWLPLAANYSAVNVELELKDSTSMLNLYKKLVKMRSTYRAFMEVSYSPVVVESEVLAYIRNTPSDPEQFLVALNFADYDVNVSITNATLPLPPEAQVYLSSNLNRTGMEDLGDFTLLGGEALIFKWNQ